MTMTQQNMNKMRNELSNQLRMYLAESQKIIAKKVIVPPEEINHYCFVSKLPSYVSSHVIAVLCSTFYNHINYNELFESEYDYIELLLNNNSGHNNNIHKLQRVVSPTQRVVSPTQRIVSPTQKIVSPTQRIVSPTQRVVSPTQRIVSPTQRIVSPTQRVAPLGSAALAQRGASSIRSKRAVSVSDEATTKITSNNNILSVSDKEEDKLVIVITLIGRNNRPIYIRNTVYQNCIIKHSHDDVEKFILRTVDFLSATNEDLYFEQNIICNKCYSPLLKFLHAMMCSSVYDKDRIRYNKMIKFISKISTVSIDCLLLEEYNYYKQVRDMAHKNEFEIDAIDNDNNNFDIDFKSDTEISNSDSCSESCAKTKTYADINNDNVAQSQDNVISLFATVSV
jgi:hypothetical protein